MLWVIDENIVMSEHSEVFMDSWPAFLPGGRLMEMMEKNEPALKAQKDAETRQSITRYNI